MARPLRLAIAGGVYHVTARGNSAKRSSATTATVPAGSIPSQVVEQYRVRCHAWVLMTNHYHLLLETPDPNLSLALRHLNGVYTQAFNRRHRRVGHLFQGRFKAIVVEKDAHFLELCQYVVLNPVRAGTATHPRLYAWSSYRATAGDAPMPLWLTVDWVLAQFGRSRGMAQRAYRTLVTDGRRDPTSPWEQVSDRFTWGATPLSHGWHAPAVLRRTWKFPGNETRRV